MNFGKPKLGPMEMAEGYMVRNRVRFTLVNHYRYEIYVKLETGLKAIF